MPALQPCRRHLCQHPGRGGRDGRDSRQDPGQRGRAGIEANNVVVVAGGGGAQVSYREPVTISAQPAPPGAQAFAAGVYRADGEPATAAGSHPYAASIAVYINTVRNSIGNIVPAGEIKTLAIELPRASSSTPLWFPSVRWEWGMGNVPWRRG